MRYNRGMDENPYRSPSAAGDGEFCTAPESAPSPRLSPVLALGSLAIAACCITLVGIGVAADGVSSETSVKLIIWFIANAVAWTVTACIVLGNRKDLLIPSVLANFLVFFAAFLFMSK